MRDCVIDLPLTMIGYHGPHTVKATIVDVAPHLAHASTWAVHQADWASYRWQVSNVETGCRLGGSESSTRAGAIAGAREALASKTPDQLTAAYKITKGYSL